VLENSLHRFLLKEGYGTSSAHVLNGARKRLLELVQSRPSELEPVASRPSEREPVASRLSEHEPVASRTSGHGRVASRPSEHEPAVSRPSAGGHDPDHSRRSDHPAVPEMMASRGHNTDGDFVYLYDKDKIYRGGAPVPGRPSAVERLTLYRHQSERKFRSIPPFHRVPRMDDDHNEHAAELESLLRLVDSGPSGSDFSETRQQERRKNGRHADDSSAEEQDEEEEAVVDEEDDLDPVEHARKPGRPSNDQLADVKAFEQRVHAEAGALAKKWAVGTDVIFDQAGFGGVAVKKTESLWNTFQKVGSVTTPANMDRKWCQLDLTIYFAQCFLSLAKEWMQEILQQYRMATRDMSHEAKKELQSELLQTFGHLLVDEQIAQSPVAKMKTVQKYVLKTVNDTFTSLFLFSHFFGGVFQAAAFSSEKDIHVVGLVFYSGNDLQARAMGVTIVTDDILVKEFINSYDIPFNKHLTDLNDLLRFVFLFFIDHL